jgi:hypothetical protein
LRAVEDWVHLPEEEERQEYVMREQGLVYKGSDKYISSMAWNFGQVHRTNKAVLYR